jgi:hypothetical protein
VARVLGFVSLSVVVYCLLFSRRPNILLRSNLTLTMKKSVLTFITVLIGATFIVSCTQQGTTATSTTRAATAKASPSPSPAKKKTAAKKKAAETEASPSPSESASPAPTP